MVVTPLRAVLWLAAVTRKVVLARTALSTAAQMIATLSWGWRCTVGVSAGGSDNIEGRALVGSAG